MYKTGIISRNKKKADYYTHINGDSFFDKPIKYMEVEYEKLGKL